MSATKVQVTNLQSGCALDAKLMKQTGGVCWTEGLVKRGVGGKMLHADWGDV